MVRVLFFAQLREELDCATLEIPWSDRLIDLDALPVGDKTLSAKEIIGNESQERMGLVIHEKDLEYLHAIADRERSPIYDVGVVTDDLKFTFRSKKTGSSPGWRGSYRSWIP